MKPPEPQLLERDIAGLVRQVVADTTGEIIHITPNDPLIASGYLDSITMVNLILALQTNYGVSVDVSMVDEVTFATAASIAGFIAQRRAEDGAP